MEASEHSATSSTAGSDGSGGGQSPWAAHQAADSVGHPEIPVIAALVGGFVFAKILKAIGGSDD
jgi:hypothetical protein